MRAYSAEWCAMYGLPGYDAWKLASPPEYDEPEEEEPPCVCGNTGWDTTDDDHFFPCTECSGVVRLEDIEDQEAEEDFASTGKL